MKRADSIVTGSIGKGTHNILCVAGARPNFMKIAPVMTALKSACFGVRLLHTGQHYDTAMNHQNFDALGLPQPDINLEVGSASHAVQTAEIMRRFEPVLDMEQPDAVLVVGDVNSTLACALVAVKKAVPVIHVEAGLRSRDRTMPEEINRILTDQISDLLFTTERDARQNLMYEGVSDHRIHFVGNVMIDTLHHNLKKAVPLSRILSKSAPANWGSQGEGYALLTLHRPSNVDDPAILRGLLEGVAELSRSLPVIFPIHPRTLDRIRQYALGGILELPSILTIPPVNYLEMLGLMKEAWMVLTDSGGIQEETTALGVPCITLRNNTERPITVIEGTNVLIGNDPARMLEACHEILRNGGKAGRIPELWDGHASERIAAVMQEWLGVEQVRTAVSA